ncbi:MAG TPA: bifunctional phosphoribosyl-AMP cyclohydrolase/phosphoribosyl-ATP diphosphatase HisIE [bacterium]|nr:bifunctional phosphoribosyl-AMP cyclohydrolase/phosphoribosyl-ATP diphosphatase HisIE [bacterium]
MFTGDMLLQDLNFQKGNGLIPAVVQDAQTRDVLMLAYQNREAVEKTRETGEMWFWSRSRQKLWHKGETSGNRLLVREVRVDCDADTLLYFVEPLGPVCHTGEQTCFGPADFSLGTLERIIWDRQQNPKAGSYTNKLLADPELLYAKIAEESAEVIDAARREAQKPVDAHSSPRRSRTTWLTVHSSEKDSLVWELADLMYHLMVLIGLINKDTRQVEQMLASRR